MNILGGALLEASGTVDLWRYPMIVALFAIVWFLVDAYFALVGEP